MNMNMSTKAALVIAMTASLTATTSKPALTCDWGCVYGIGAGISILGALLAPPPMPMPQPNVVYVPVPVPVPAVQPQETPHVSPPVSERERWCRTSHLWYHYPDVQTCDVPWSR